MTREFTTDISSFDGDDNAMDHYDVLSWVTVDFEIRGQGNWVKFRFTLSPGDTPGSNWTLTSLEGFSADGKWDFSVEREEDKQPSVSS